MLSLLLIWTITTLWAVGVAFSCYYIFKFSSRAWHWVSAWKTKITQVYYIIWPLPTPQPSTVVIVDMEEKYNEAPTPHEPRIDAYQWLCTYPSLDSIVGYATLIGVMMGARAAAQYLMQSKESDKVKKQQIEYVRHKLWTYIDAALAVVMIPIGIKLGLPGAAVVFSRLRLFVAYLHTIASSVSIITSVVTPYPVPMEDALLRMQTELEERETRIKATTDEVYTPEQLKPGLCAALGYANVEEASAEFSKNIALAPAKGAKLSQNKQGLGYVDSQFRMALTKCSAHMKAEYVAIGVLITACVFLVGLYMYTPVKEVVVRKRKPIHVSGNTKVGKKEPSVLQRDSDELPVNSVEPDQPYTYEPMPAGAKWGDYEMHKHNIPKMDKQACYQFMKGKCTRDACKFPHIALCADVRCAGACKQVHLVSKKPKKISIQREVRFDNPIVPMAEHTLAVAECNGGMCNAVLVMGWWFIPHHLLNDNHPVVLTRNAERHVIPVARMVRCGDLDLMAFQLTMPGLASMKHATPIVGEDAVMVAWLDGKRTISYGRVLSVSATSAGHNVSTVAGHCCGALTNKHGHLIGFHISGGPSQNTFIPLTETVTNLIRGLKV